MSVPDPHPMLCMYCKMFFIACYVIICIRSFGFCQYPCPEYWRDRVQWNIHAAYFPINVCDTNAQYTWKICRQTEQAGFVDEYHYFLVIHYHKTCIKSIQLLSIYCYKGLWTNKWLYILLYSILLYSKPVTVGFGIYTYFVIFKTCRAIAMTVAWVCFSHSI